MMADTSGKIESGKNDPAELARLLEIELTQKRAEWKRASRRNRAIKVFGLFFLFFVIAGVIAAVLLGLSLLHDPGVVGR